MPNPKGEARASIRPSEAKARKPYDKTEFRTEFSRSKNPKINENFLVRTTSGDDVIVTEKNSKTPSAAVSHGIKSLEPQVSLKPVITMISSSQTSQYKGLRAFASLGEL